MATFEHQLKHLGAQAVFIIALINSKIAQKLSRPDYHRKICLKYLKFTRCADTKLVYNSPMVSIAHATTGAFIASVLPYPWAYIPLSLASHFALDFVRHYDVGVAMKRYRLTKMQIVFWESLDLILSVGVIALIWQQALDHLDYHLWIGAFFGILPDILETSDYFFHQPLAILRPIYKLHDTFHHSTRNFWWGALPQIILVSIIALAANWSS